MGVVKENALMIVVALVLVALVTYIVFLTTGGVSKLSLGMDKILCTSTASLRGYVFSSKYMHWAYYKHPELFSKVDTIFPVMCKKQVYFVSPVTDYDPVNKYDDEIKEKELANYDEGSDEYNSRLAYWRLVYLLRDQAKDCSDRYDHGDPLFPGGYGKNPAICSIIFYDLNNTFDVKVRKVHFDENAYGLLNPGLVPLRNDADIREFVEEIYGKKECDAILFPTHSTDFWPVNYEDEKCENVPTDEAADSLDFGCGESCTLVDSRLNNVVGVPLSSSEREELIRGYMDGSISEIRLTTDADEGNFIWCSTELYEKALGNADYLCANFTYDPEYDVPGLINDVMTKLIKKDQKWWTDQKEINSLGMGQWICGARGGYGVQCPLYAHIDGSMFCPGKGSSSLAPGYDCIYITDWVEGYSKDTVKGQHINPTDIRSGCAAKPHPGLGINKPASLSRGVIFVTFLDLWDDNWNDVVWGRDFMGEGRYVPTKQAAIPPNNKVVFVIFDESWMLPGRGVVPTNDPGTYPSFGCLQSSTALLKVWSGMKNAWVEGWSNYAKDWCKGRSKASVVKEALLVPNPDVITGGLSALGINYLVC